MISIFFVKHLYNLIMFSCVNVYNFFIFQKLNGESKNRPMPVTMDGVFRRPLIAPLPMIHKKPNTESFAAQLDVSMYVMVGLSYK